MKVQVGEKYNRLTVIDILPDKIICKCECGNLHSVKRSWYLYSGNTRSCGCLHKEMGWLKKHGLTHHPLYKTWHNIRSRCKNPNATKYRYYGGKGIKVCSEWDNDFKVFYDWSIANGWDEGLTIDRINSNKDYSPDNCRWVDYIVQNNNLSSNHTITYKGKTQSVYAWAKELNINQKTFSERLRRGWTIERAMKQPVQARKKVMR